MKFSRSWLAATALLMAGCASPPAPAYHLASSIPLPDGGWDYASVDPALNRVYLARTDGVTMIDLGTRAVTGKLVPAARGHEVLPLSEGSVLLVTNGASGNAQFVDARTGAVLATVKTGDAPDAAIIDPSSGMIMVMNHVGGSVTIVDPRTRTAVAEIKVGGTLEFAAFDDEGHLFVNDEDASEIVEVDVAARRQLARIKLGGCEGPTGLAYLPASQRLLAACDNELAAIVNPKTATFERTLAIGEGPDAVIYDHKRHVAFIPSGGSGDLSVFADEAGGIRETGRFTTQIGARTGSVDEATGRVYLPAAMYDPPETAGGRPKIRSGTVVMLEIVS